MKELDFVENMGDRSKKGGQKMVDAVSKEAILNRLEQKARDYAESWQC